MLRREFVERKLQLIAEDLGRLTEFRDISYEQLIEDPVRQAAIERMLERIEAKVPGRALAGGPPQADAVEPHSRSR